MSGSMGVAYSDIWMEGGSVRGRVSGAGNIEINITQWGASRLLVLRVWAGKSAIAVGTYAQSETNICLHEEQDRLRKENIPG
jgi:hypothetical protein